MILNNVLNDVDLLCRHSLRSINALRMAEGDDMSAADEKAKRLNEQAAALREGQ